MQWAQPGTMNALWIALEDITLERAPIIYVKGSHRWLSPHTDEYRQRTRQGGVDGFLESVEFDAAVEAAALAAGEIPEYVKIEVPRGGGVFHDGWTWHGSDMNVDTVDRYSLSIHCMPSDAMFSAVFNDPIESRYKQHDSLEMDASFYPVLWTEQEGRSKWIDGYFYG